MTKNKSWCLDGVLKLEFFVSLFFITSLFTACSNNNYSEIVEIEHVVDASVLDRADPTPNFQAMLASFFKQDDLYCMTFHGNFDELLDYHHQKIMEYFKQLEELERDSLHCSLFTYLDKSNKMYLGRNFDNRDTEVLIGLFLPDSGFASIGFVPLIEFKFDKQHPFDPASGNHRKLLLHSPVTTVDGLNEKGVVVTVASVRKEEVQPDTAKTYRFLLHLQRNILDHAFDVQSAIDIASRFNVFDNSKHNIAHHLLIADSSGQSVVLEWHEGKMRIIENSSTWQIATNTKMFGKTDEELSRACNRFSRIYSRLKNAPDTLSWQQGMDALRSAKQVNKTYYFDSGAMRISTQWSALFNISDRTVYVCTNRNYDRVYRFELHEKAFYRPTKNE